VRRNVALLNHWILQRSGPIRGILRGVWRMLTQLKLDPAAPAELNLSLSMFSWSCAIADIERIGYAAPAGDLRESELVLLQQVSVYRTKKVSCKK
jgi:hypothetical protein